MRCEQEGFEVGVAYEYARSWLEDHLTGTAARVLTGVTGQAMGARFVVLWRWCQGWPYPMNWGAVQAPPRRVYVHN